MASAIFVAQIENGSPKINMEDMVYTDEISGEQAGGFSVIGNAPNGETVVVRVWSSDEKLDLLSENPDFLFIQDVVEV